MSVTVTNSPEGRRILEEIIEAYAAAEANLIGLVRDALAREAIGTAGFYQRQAQALAKVQSDARRALQQLTGGLEESLQQLLISEYQATSAMVAGGAVAQGVNAPAIAAVAAEIATTLTSSHTTILRTVIDEYRRIISRGVTDAITSGQPQQQMIQGLLNKFADRGITSFTDRSGRRWSMRSYIEMALRTGVTRAQNEGRRTGYAKTGVELILTSSHIACAPQCLPFQGRVLAMRGSAGKREVIAPDGKTVTVDVVATFDDALRAGYHHVNCRHTDTPYVPGMKIPKPVETDEKDYKAQQRQREIERNIRRWKLRKTAALDKPAERKANSRIRMWQKAQRDHVAQYPWMARNYQREKVITASGK